ncbi:MAG: hypothetical protein FJ044_05055 [Candidatus Cloacimonetes bacterium]|nr:hypothetical protein [Candidatus Cloacimonadota bacterium]
MAQVNPRLPTNLFLPEDAGVVMAQSGEASFVMLPIKQYEAFLETIDILADPEQSKVVLRSLDELKRGETLPIESIL